MDWDLATQGWVDAGLIEPEQREPLRDWLVTHAPRPRGLPFLDTVLTAVVTAGTWLLTGSAVLAVVMLDLHEDAPAVVAIVASGFQIALGLGVRLFGGRPVSQGLWSGAVVVLVVALTVLWLDARSADAALWLPALLVPAAFAGWVGLLDRMPGLIASAAFASVLPIVVFLQNLHDPPIPEGIAFLALFGTVLASVGARVWPDRLAGLAGSVPFATFVGIVAILYHEPILKRWVSRDVWAWEGGLLIGMYGIAVLLAGAVSMSRLVLLSGIAALVVSECLLLAAIGNVWVAVGVLGAEGTVLMGGAVLALGVRSGRSARGPEES